MFPAEEEANKLPALSRPVVAGNQEWEIYKFSQGENRSERDSPPGRQHRHGFAVSITL
jgi:hypothetical protein